MGCELSLVRLAILMAARLAETALAGFAAAADIVKHLNNGLFVMRTAVRRTALRLADTLQADPAVIARYTAPAPDHPSGQSPPRARQPSAASPKALSPFGLDRLKQNARAKHKTPRDQRNAAAPPPSASATSDTLVVERMRLAARILNLKTLAVMTEAALRQRITRMAHAIVRLRLASHRRRAPFDLFVQARDETRLDAILAHIEATAQKAAARPQAPPQSAPVPSLPAGDTS